MEESSDSSSSEDMDWSFEEQWQNSRFPQHQRRTFYNGRETESASSLPYQRRGERNARRENRGSNKFSRRRADFQKSRCRYANPRMASNSNVSYSTSGEPPKSGPNSVDVDRNEKSHKESDPQDESGSNDVRNFLRAKEVFFSMKNSISRSVLVMDYRQQIQNMSELCTAKNFEKIKKISSLTRGEEAYVSIFKLHYKNLILQQKQFDAFISGQKNECIILHENDIDDIIRRADGIKKSVQIECKLFERTLPAYAYKDDLLRELERNEVILVASDCSYFFDTVVPIVLLNECPDYSVVSCESSALSCDWVRRDVESVLAQVDGTLKMESMVETDMLNYLNEGISSKKHCFIFSLPLTRSVASDLLLSVFRDLLMEQKQHRLILLLSIFDDVKKFENYFLDVRVFTLEVPELLLPVQTVWKNGASENYKDDVLSTALAVHVLNGPGDVFVFLPNLAEAKTTLAMFVTHTKELGYDDVDCTLLHEDSYNVADLRQRTASRKFFFIPSSAAVRPMPTVKYLIDCGLVRGSLFDDVTNLDVLTTAFHSRALARLRKSLVGVFVSGVCYRTYNKGNFFSDMRSYELPDILTLNPFDTLLTLFRHQPEKALSVTFVEPLSDAVKNNAVKLLKNFNAIKDERLSEFGKKMVKLPFSARYSKLILQSLQWDFAYEAVILVAFLSSDLDVFRHFKNEDSRVKADAAKLELVQCESDALAFLHIYKCWTDDKNSKTWCEKYIEHDTLIEVKSKVIEICNTVSRCLNENIVPQFSKEKNAASHVAEMLFHCFADHLCVYSGHYRCGYRILSSRQTALLHPSTVLCNRDDMPRLVVFNRIVRDSSSGRDFLSGVSAVSSEWVRASLENKTLDCDYAEFSGRSLASRTIERVSERIVRQVLLGGKKLQEVETSVKEKLKSDWIVVDPSPEEGRVHIYALTEVLDSAVKMVKDVLKNGVEDVLELKREVVTVPVRRRNPPRRVRGCHSGETSISAARADSEIAAPFPRKRKQTKR